MKFELVPMNKYVVIKPRAEDEKVGREGLIYRPASALEKQHRMGEVIAFDECDEARKLHVGATVIYDAIGSVEHRVGNDMLTTVKVLNVIAVVRPGKCTPDTTQVDPNTIGSDELKGKIVYDPQSFEPKRVI